MDCPLTHSHGHLDHRVRHGLDHGPDGPDWEAGVIIAVIIAALIALALTGCAPPGDYYGDKTTVADANTAPGGFGGITRTPPAVVAAAVKSAGWLNGLGAALLAAGCVTLSQAGIRNSLGFGLALAGVSLLVAGFILPVYAGWVGLALFGGLVVWFWGRMRVDTPPPGQTPLTRLNPPTA